jgi:glycosyltransferase involved in cell wall biosynthesis
MVTLSVVIPCLNGADVLPDQLDALARQEWDGSWEVVVADNGSTDGTAEVALAHADRLPRIRVVDASVRRGAATALNVGIAAAEADAMVFLDADDLAAPGYLAAMAAALEEHDFVAASYDSESLNEAAMIKARGYPQRDGLLNGYRFLPYAGAGGLGLRRRVVDGVGDFDTEIPWLFEIDFCWRAQCLGFTLEFVPDAVVRIRFPADTSALYRQSRNWSSIEPLLYRRFRDVGMPRSSFREAAKGWARAVVRSPELGQLDRRGYYLRGVGKQVGRLQGSMHNRVLYL